MCRLFLAFLIFLCVESSGCGGSSSTPTTPTPTPTTVSIAVVLDSLIKVGEIKQAQAAAALSNGMSQPLTSGWLSDQPAVASVTNAGAVTGVSNGRATIFIASEGRQGQQVVRVLPDYQGQWSGSYIVNSCTQSGTFAAINWCADAPVNRVFPTNATFTQSGEAVSGRLFLGASPSDSFSVPIGTDGAIAITAVFRTGVFTDNTTWRLVSSQANRMTGTFTITTTATGYVGSAVLALTIRDFTRSSATAVAPFPILMD